MLCMAWLMPTSPLRESSTLFHVHHTPDLRPSFCFFDQATLMPPSAPLHVPCLLSDVLPQNKPVPFYHSILQQNVFSSEKFIPTILSKI